MTALWATNNLYTYVAIDRLCLQHLSGEKQITIAVISLCDP